MNLKALTVWAMTMTALSCGQGLGEPGDEEALVASELSACATCSSTVPPVGVLVEDGPMVPAGFSIIGRDGLDGVRVRWVNRSSATRATLYRSASSTAGPWVQAAVLRGPLVGGAATEMVDAGAPVDGFACYRVVVADANGSTASNGVCTFTRDGRGRRAWRAQVRLHTSTRAGSSSDSSVRVRLQGPTGYDTLPSGNATWLDTPGDDFAGGANRWYELQLKNVRDVSDVTMIKIELEGTDDLCLQDLELRLDERSVFSVNWGASTCRQLAQGQPLIITHDQLRASPDWPNLGTGTAPVGIDFPWLDALVTSMVGNAMHGYDIAFQSGSGNPATTTVDEHRRRYTYRFWKGIFPVTLGFELFTWTTCEAMNGQQRAVGHLRVENEDADVAGYLVLIYPISEFVLELFEPDFPPIQINGAIGTCVAQEPQARLCFDSYGLTSLGCH